MRKNKIVAVMLLVFVLALSFVLTACVTDEHQCTSKCPECGKCLNKECTQEACKEKCPGHDETPGHVCGHKCPTCGKCTDATCTDPVCADKCPGHEPTPPAHECTSKCPVCGKCTNKDCTEEVCKDKCQGHENDQHKCQHVCATCGGCYNETCTDPICATKCDCVSGLENAKEYLRSLYIDAKYEATSANYDVVDHVRVKEPHSGVMTDYVVTWTITIDPGTTAPATIAKGEGKWTVTVSTEKFSTNQEYKLVGTVTDAEGNTLSVTFNRYVPAYKVLSYDEFVKAADDADVAVQGIVTGIISKTNGNKSNGLYLQSLDNKGGFYIYNMANDPVTDKIEVGMKVEAVGKKDVFNGTLEVIDATVTVLEKTPATVTPVDLTEAFKAASDLKATTLTYGQALLVKLTGVTVLPQDGDTANGYYKFQLGDKTSYVRISSSVCPMVKDAQTTMIANHKEKAGYIADVVGLVTLYSGSFYLTPVSADAFSNFQLPELSGQEAINVEKEFTTLDEEILTDKVIDLPTAGSVYSKVAISWAFKADTTYKTATLDGNKLTIKLADDAETITLVATFKEGEVADTKEYTIKIASKIIVWNDAATAIAECKKLDGTKNETSTEWYYVYGTIIDDPTADYCNFNLTDGTDKIICYGLWNTEGTKRYGTKRDIAELPVKKGDVVYLYAQLQNYNGKYELVNARLQPAPEEGSNVICPLTVAKAAEICTALETAGVDSEKKYYIKGIVGEIYNTDYCNFYLVDGSEVKLTVYGLWANATERYGAKRQIATFPFKQGDEMVIYGNLQKFVKGETTTLEITNGLLISYATPAAGKTDADKVADAEKAIGTTLTISKTGETELYTSTDVTVTWAINGETTLATLAGNKLTVAALPTDADGTFTLTATIKSGEVEKTVDVTVTVKKVVTTVNDGTAEKPYTVEEVVAVTANLAKDEYTKNMVYVKGIVKSFEKGSYVKNLYLVDTTDSTVSFLVFSANFSDTVKEIAVGDTIVVKGAVKNYNGTIEMTNVKVNNETVHGFPSFISCTAGQGTISIAEGSSDKATVTIANDQKTGENYTTFVFEVTVAEGYELVSVKVDGVVVTAESGKYTGRIAGNTVILVETKVAGAKDPVVVGSLTFPATKQDSVGSYSMTWTASNDYSAWSISNFNNNKNDATWTYIKCGSKNAASIASIVNTTAIADAITKINVKFSSIGNVNSIKLIVAKDAACTDIVETIDGSTSAKDQVFNITTPTAGLYYKLVIDCSKASKNGPVVLTQLDYYAVK